MPSAVEVILKEEVSSLGKAGDLVRVKPGYARNYLIPRGYALAASKDNVKQIEAERANAIKRAEARLADAREIASKVEGVSITLKARAGESEKLFGAITSADISEALSKKTEIMVDKKQVLLSAPIKELGTFPIEIVLASEVRATVEVVVEKED